MKVTAQKSEKGGAVPLRASKAPPLSGRLRPPGDKSISHRALIVGALAIGETEIQGLLEGDDVLRTKDAVVALGAFARREENNVWRIAGLGVGGFAEPERVLDLGNSGTGVRLLMGAVAAHPLLAVFIGDESLSRRPMGRVLAPLRAMGAACSARAGDRLPVTLKGGRLRPLVHRPEIPSAQVKSAILLAGLGTSGLTSVIERIPTRDHSERLLRHFGAELKVEDAGAEGTAITIKGWPELQGRVVKIPADPSSAAFPLVASLIVPGSAIQLENVCLNPGRTGLLETLTEMGADIVIENRRVEGGEDVGDIAVRASTLRAVDVPAARAPFMIDEYPVLAMAAACAEGRMIMRGLSELRVKESDRLLAIAEGLARCGVKFEIEADDLVVHGMGEGAKVPGGAMIETRMDHRIGMSFLVLGLVSKEPIAIDDGSMIATSFPNFVQQMSAIGARIEQGAGD